MMRAHCFGYWLTLASLLIGTGESSAKADKAVSFVRDVAPLLVQRCQGCHGAKQSDSNYRLDTVEWLGKSGDYGEPIVTAGKPQESLLWRLVSSENAEERMPKDGDALSPDELTRIEQWIVQGAEFDVPEPSKALATQLPRPAYGRAPDLYRQPVPILALAWDRPHDRVVAGGYRELTVWDANSGTLLQRIGAVTERTTMIVASPDKSLFAICGGEPGSYGEVRLMHANDWSEARFLGMTSDLVMGVAFRPDGLELAAAFPDQTVRVFETATGQQRLKLESHADWVTCIAWSPDGKRLASGSRDKTAKVFESENGNLVATYSAHGATVWSLVFAHDGSAIYSCGDDKKIHLWKAEDGSQQAVIASHTGPVHRLALDNDSLWSVSADGNALQSKVADRSLMRTNGNHPDWVTALAWDADQQRLATGCLNGQVRLVNYQTAAPPVEFVAAPGFQGVVAKKSETSATASDQ